MPVLMKQTIVMNIHTTRMIIFDDFSPYLEVKIIAITIVIRRITIISIIAAADIFI
jgi:hypothetical protein